MSSELTRFRERTYPPPFPDGWYRVAASEPECGLPFSVRGVW